MSRAVTRPNGAGLFTILDHAPRLKTRGKSHKALKMLINFIRESNRIEGIMREPTPLEIRAHEEILSLKELSVSDVENFVSIISPGDTLRRSIGQNVRIGKHHPMQGSPAIELILRELLVDEYLSVFQLHVAYEHLHPFTDGNGRSGRAIWLWKMKGNAPLGFLHTFYYQSLEDSDKRLRLK